MAVGEVNYCAEDARRERWGKSRSVHFQAAQWNCHNDFVELELSHLGSDEHVRFSIYCVLCLYGFDFCVQMHMSVADGSSGYSFHDVLVSARNEEVLYSVQVVSQTCALLNIYEDMTEMVYVTRHTLEQRKSNT